jgi:5-(carboxyamino)imidazole ribonucleotide mutase
MPSGVAPLTILSPENAALAAAKILGLSNPDIQKRIFDFQDKKRKELEEADNALIN